MLLSCSVAVAGVVFRMSHGTAVSLVGAAPPVVEHQEVFLFAGCPTLNPFLGAVQMRLILGFVQTYFFI